MREAIGEALLADQNNVYPNPRVGAVIVENGAIAARARFECDGGMHAERKALAALERATPGSDNVCNHGALLNSRKNRSLHRCHYSIRLT